MSTQTKVYISNLNYHTTEDELREHLAGTNAANIFIPNYFLGFGSSRFKPLGIAYADFPTSKEAEEFIESFDGSQFKDRKLKAKLHVPYAPSQKISRRSSVNSITKLTSRNGNENSKEEKLEITEKAVRRNSVEKRYSAESVFVKGLKAKTTEEDLRVLFKDFNPKQIRIIKPRGWIRGLKNRSHSAIITLDIPQEQALVEILRICTGDACCGSTVKVSRAYSGVEGEGAVQESVLNDSELPDATQSEVRAEDVVQTPGPAVEPFAAAVASEVEPDANDGSKESTMKSFDQENASGKAIHELNIHSENEVAVQA